MENKLQIKNISGVDCYEKDGMAYLKLEAVARGLGFTDNSKGVEYVRWNTVKQYLADIGFSQEVAKTDYIPENVFYRLAMKAKNETAERFQAFDIRTKTGRVSGISYKHCSVSHRANGYQYYQERRTLLLPHG